MTEKIPDAQIEAHGTPRIPDHELVRRIGSGGYGEVWLARSLTGSYRAVKVVRRKPSQNTGPFEREFSGILKFEPISRSHDGFVDILQVGKNDQEGYFYYVMEPADDRFSGQKIDPDKYSPKTLADELSRRGRLPYGECLKIGLSLTAALEHLHNQKLVHRDIKPSNIIFVNGAAKLADIGLVTAVGQATLVGTEGYIPPEGVGGPQADLFALGKVLYEISTGRDRLKFPELASTTPEAGDEEGMCELNDVIVKACEHDARNRYQTAYEMHADLLLLQQGKSLRRQRSARKRKTIALAVALALVLVAFAALLHRDWAPRRSPPTDPLPSHVAVLPAADVLKIAYGGSPPPPPPQYKRPHLRVQIMAKRARSTEFAPLADGDKLASEKDDYCIVVQSFSPGYLYVFQVDSSGKKEWLFPQNGSSALSWGANPLNAGETVTVPSVEAKQSLYLDKNVGVEHIYAVFSATQWPELETALAKPAFASTKPVRQPNGLELRGVGGARVTDASLPVEASGAVLVVERWFQHTAE